MTLRQRIREAFNFLSVDADPRSTKKVMFYSPSYFRDMMPDLKIQSLANELHRMADEGLLQKVLLRDNLYPPARRYGFRMIPR